MPRISINEFPTVARSGRVSKYAEQEQELDELLSEDNFGAGSGVMFDIDKDELSALVSRLRKVGANHDRKVKTVFADGSVYVTDGGAMEAKPKAQPPEATEPASATAIRAGVAARGGRAKK